MMVTKVWKHVRNVGHQRSRPLTNSVAEVVQMTYAVNAILQVWMALLEPIPEDILEVCRI
jgi:hypothetical protein